MTAEQRGAIISEIIDRTLGLHRESGFPFDPLDLYEAMQSILRMENILRELQHEAAE